ncbi:MAG: S8 family serine peptidase [Planctomycetota bacterium]
MSEVNVAMGTQQRLKQARDRELLVVSILAVAGLCPCSGVRAASMTYYAGGGVYPLERSETEWVIELLGADTAAAADVRFRMLGPGRVERMPWGRADVRFAILHVDRADAESQAQVSAHGLVKAVRHVYRFHPDGLPHIGTGRLVIKLAAGVSQEALGELLGGYSVRRLRTVGSGGRTHVLEPVDPATDEVELAARLHADRRVEYAHPDLISPLFKMQVSDGDFTANLPTDPYFELQWHLNNTGQEGGVSGADINVLQAFDDGASGAGVIVGMLDDACDVLHEDLLSNFMNASHDAVTGEVSQLAANPTSASERHGTAMMGLICAVRDNNRGVVGVAPQARFTASRGADEGLSASDVAAAFDFALERQVDVHCNGWAGEAGAPSPDTVRGAVEDAFTTGRGGLGMVVVFPTGNAGEELSADSSLAVLKTEDDKKLVIGVGACNAIERVTSYSNYGIGVVDVLAPSGDVFLPQIVTTDNTDEAAFDSPGYNLGGFDDFNLPNLGNPQYTQGDSFSDVADPDFFGTSAASAQVAGAAALVLGATRGPALTATQVRATLEHTADKIPLTDPNEGDYNVITGRSLRYGYGRVNAGKAVSAARLVTDSSAYTWPERVKNVTVADGVGEGQKILSWVANDDLRTLVDGVQGDATTSVLVVGRIGLDFEWVPTDGMNYFLAQTVDFEQNVGVAQVGDNTSYEFSDLLGIVYFGIFARNAAGRYSFGVSINSEGEVVEVGRSTHTGLDNLNANDNTGGTPPPGTPTVAIAVSPLSGVSPLTVTFRGNSPNSDSPIVSVLWDFGDGSASVDQAVAQHTYTLPGNTTMQFTATFTVVDADGDAGQRSVVITVFSTEGDEPEPSTGAIRIIISAPGEAPRELAYGEVGSPVELSVDTSHIVGTPQSIFWSLGDGATAGSFIVLHTYQIPGTFPVLANVTARTTSGEDVVFSDSYLFTVLEIVGNGNGNANGNGNDNSLSPSTGGGGGGVACGAGALLPMIALLGLVVLRRLRFA